MVQNSGVTTADNENVWLDPPIEWHRHNIGVFHPPGGCLHCRTATEWVKRQATEQPLAPVPATARPMPTWDRPRWRDRPEGIGILAWIIILRRRDEILEWLRNRPEPLRQFMSARADESGRSWRAGAFPDPEHPLDSANVGTCPCKCHPPDSPTTIIPDTSRMELHE
jgi:hypothetical protein